MLSHTLHAICARSPIDDTQMPQSKHKRTKKRRGEERSKQIIIKNKKYESTEIVKTIATFKMERIFKSIQNEC